MGMIRRFDETGYLDAFAEAWTAGDGAVIRFFAPDADYYCPALGTQMKAERLAEFLDPWLAFSPDLQLTFTSEVRAERHFTAEWKMVGTATGPLSLGGVELRGNGSRFEAVGISFAEVDDHGALLWFKDYWSPAGVAAVTVPAR